jgi:hypothetical protein
MFQHFTLILDSILTEIEIEEEITLGAGERPDFYEFENAASKAIRPYMLELLPTLIKKQAEAMHEVCVSDEKENAEIDDWMNLLLQSKGMTLEPRVKSPEEVYARNHRKALVIPVENGAFLVVYHDIIENSLRRDVNISIHFTTEESERFSSLIDMLANYRRLQTRSIYTIHQTSYTDSEIPARDQVGEHTDVYYFKELKQFIREMTN